MKKKWKCYLTGRNRCKFTFTQYAWLLLMVCGLLNLSSCKDDSVVEGGKYNPDQPVVVTDILPGTGGILTPVVIEGKNFGEDKTKVQVFFDEREAVIINVSNEYIYAIVPKCADGDTEVKVIIDGKNEGVLKEIKFDYVVSSKVTSIATEFTNTFKDLQDISIDNADNLIICQLGVVKLYSIKAKAMATILDMGIDLRAGCFSPDFKKYYVLPLDPAKGLAIVLDKEKNWQREVIYDTYKVSEGILVFRAITVNDEGFIYAYGRGEGKGIILKINPNTKEAKKLGEFPYDKIQSIAFNPKDKFIYMSLTEAGRIFRFDSRKETLTPADCETVTGSKASTYKDGILSEATFCYPMGLEFDHDNNLYVADETGPTIRKIDLTAGIVSTFAGKQGPSSYVDGSAETARFNHPTDVAVTPDGIVYVMEFFTGGSGGALANQLRCVAVQ